jgi:hypothetical protein
LGQNNTFHSASTAGVAQSNWKVCFSPFVVELVSVRLSVSRKQHFPRLSDSFWFRCGEALFAQETIVGTSCPSRDCRTRTQQTVFDGQRFLRHSPFGSSWCRPSDEVPIKIGPTVTTEKRELFSALEGSLSVAHLF